MEGNNETDVRVSEKTHSLNNLAKAQRGVPQPVSPCIFFAPLRLCEKYETKGQCVFSESLRRNSTIYYES